MSFHREAVEGDIHVIYDQTYADTAAREADTDWNGDSTNIGKTVFVTDISAVYLLLSTTPTWSEFTNEGSNEFEVQRVRIYNKRVNQTSSETFLTCSI